MKLGQISDNRFHAALNRLSSQMLPLRAAFKIKGMAAKIAEEFKKYEEVRQIALNKYGNKTAEGKLDIDENQQVRFSAENSAAFAEELNALNLVEVEISTIKLSELGETLLMSADDIAALGDLLAE